MRTSLTRLAASLGLLSSVSAQSSSVQTQSYCPGSGVCYAINVPSASATSTGGPIFFQLSGPSTMQWIGMGQGGQMAGSNIFVVYADADGQNVTLSPRLGLGEFMPMHNTAAQVTLLEGSGISNGKMIANIRCDNCNSWSGGSMSYTSTSANFIYAWKGGAPLDSNDPSATIVQHDQNEPFTFDLTKATGGDSSNPFIAANLAPTASGAATGTSGASPSNTAPASTVPTGSSSGSGSAAPSFNVTTLMNCIKAHGLLMSLAWLVLFPIGAMLMRAGQKWAFTAHVAIQWTAYLMTWAALGLAVWFSRQIGLFNTTHAYLGLFLVSFTIVQPISGMLQHSHYKKNGARGPAGWFHAMIGRAILIIAFANGFLGLQLAQGKPVYSYGAYVAYATIGSVMIAVYIVVFGVTAWSRRRNGDAGKAKRSGSDDVVQSAPQMAKA